MESSLYSQHFTSIISCHPHTSSYYCSDFTLEEYEIKRCQAACPMSQADQWHDEDASPGLHGSTAQALTLHSCCVIAMAPSFLIQFSTHYDLQLRVQSVLEAARLVGTACCRVRCTFYCQPSSKETDAYRWGICFLTIWEGKIWSINSCI